ncbi:hypothetical protein MLD38_008763 [Melastoma candidum]|nr:hypothetical protein MLD38_008763 [Melastoma candidum]
MPSDIPYEATAECIRKFNEAFMAEYRKQKSWIVPDGNLRDQIRESLSKKFTSVYEEFREMHFCSNGPSGKEKGQPRMGSDDFGNYLAHLFRGAPVPESSSTGLSSSTSNSTRTILCLPRRNTI